MIPQSLCRGCNFPSAQALFLMTDNYSSYDAQQSLAFARDMVEKYRCLIKKAAGFNSVVVDGQTVSLTDLETKLEHWEKKYTRASGRKPVISQITLGGV